MERLGARIGEDEAVVRVVLDLHRSVFTRLAAGFEAVGAAEQAELSAKMAGRKKLDVDAYVGFVREVLEPVGAIIDRFVSTLRGKDAFAVKAAMVHFVGAARRALWSDLSAAHRTVLQRLDAQLTSLQLERGDPADFLQNLRWQRALYRGKPALRKIDGAAQLVAATQDVIHAIGERRAPLRDAAKAIQSQFEAFAATAKALPQLRLQPALERMAAAERDLAAMQKAHREFLLALDRLPER